MSLSLHWALADIIYYIGIGYKIWGELIFHLIHIFNFMMKFFRFTSHITINSAYQAKNYLFIG